MGIIMRKSGFMIAGALLALLLFADIGRAAAPAKKLRLAYGDWGVASAIAYIGIDGGIFKKFNIDVEEIFFRDAMTGGVQALIGADILLGFGNPLAVIQPILSGADLVLLGSHVSDEKFGMCVSETIASMKDLKGMKIGVSALGGRSDLAARVMLRRAGLDPVKDVEVVIAGVSASRTAAVNKDLIQGTPLNFGLSTQAKQLGLRVLDERDVPLVSSLLVTTRSFVKKDEEFVRRFVKAYASATHFYLTHRSESIDIIKKYFSGTDRRALEGMYEAFASQLKPLPNFNTEALQAMIDVAGVADKRASNLKAKEIVDPRFVDELQASGYIEQLYKEKVSL